jgi:tetratricopeptide (TPR) repeat protein
MVRRAVGLLMMVILLTGAVGTGTMAAAPSSAEALGRGLLYLQLGLPELALSQVESAAQREGATSDTVVLYGLLLAATGRAAKAAETLAGAERQVVAGGVGSLTPAEVRTFTAGALAASGATGDAAKTYDAAVAEEPDLGLAHVGLAALAEAGGEPVRAVAEYERYLELSPEDGSAWAALGRLYAQAGRKAEAVTALERGTRLNPGLDWAIQLLHRLKEEA